MADDSGIAGFVQESTTPAEVALFVGEWQIATESAPSLAAITQYQLCALTATGITLFIAGTHLTENAVIAAATVAAAAIQVPYWNSGKFNWVKVGLPVHADFDSLADLKFQFAGKNIQFGHTI